LPPRRREVRKKEEEKPMQPFASPIAAIVHEARSAAVDQLILDAARRLRARGVKLGGLVQHNVEKDGTDCAEMLLEDLVSARRVSISLRRTKGSPGCRLDPAGLAEAAALGTQGITSGVDLVIISKFGAQEAAGKGLREELALAVMSATPLLTSVSRRLLPAWEDFIGENWTMLPPDLAAVEAWGIASLSPSRHLRERVAEHREVG
jgi:nucleoside-triphosphatase THEP1